MLSIPSVGVRAPIVGADITAGEYAVPSDPAVVGAHRANERDLGRALAPTPGVLLVAGHVTLGATRGALWPLHRLEPGAELLTTGPGGVRRWRAVALEIHRADALPADLLRPSGPEQLVLVTCTGPVVDDHGRRSYRDNLLVTAVPV